MTLSLRRQLLSGTSIFLSQRKVEYWFSVHSLRADPLDSPALVNDSECSVLIVKRPRKE